MDTERLKITAETAAIRGRGWVRLLVRLVGIALVIIAGSNLLLADSVWPVVVYRDLWVAATAVPAWPVGGFIAIGDRGRGGALSVSASPFYHRSRRSGRYGRRDPRRNGHRCLGARPRGRRRT